MAKRAIGGVWLMQLLSAAWLADALVTVRDVPSSLRSFLGLNFMHRNSSGPNLTTELRTCTDDEVARYAFLMTYGPLEGLKAPLHAPLDCVPRRQRDVVDRIPLLAPAYVSRAQALHQHQGGNPFFVQLNVYKVDKEWCSPPCHSVTWERAAAKPSKNNTNYQLLEACIWRAERRVALYEFDEAFYIAAQNSYHDLCGGIGWQCHAVHARREGARLYEATWDYNLEGAALSSWLAIRFNEILQIVYKRNSLHYGLSFAGHGSTADGALFEGLISATDTKVALKIAAHKKLSLINFGGNCVEGQWNNLNVLKDFGDYVIASDLTVNGLQIEDEKREQEYLRLHSQLTPPSHMLLLLKDRLSPQDLGQGLLNGQRKLWEFGTTAIKRTKLKQSMALYNMRNFQQLRVAMTEAWKAASTDVQHKVTQAVKDSMCDIRAFGKSIGSSKCDAAFLALRIGYVSTADMFKWDVATNGLGFNFLGWNGPPCDMSHAIGGAAGIMVCSSPPKGFRFKKSGFKQGGCETFSPGGINHELCEFCMTNACELKYQEVCPECGACAHVS